MKSLYSSLVELTMYVDTRQATIETLGSTPEAIFRGELGAAESIDGRMTRA